MKRMILMAAVLLLSLQMTAAATTRVNDFSWNSVRLLERNGQLHNWAQWIEGEVALSGGIGTGNVYYVDSNVTAEGDGTSWENAKDTLDEAVGLCTADNGDVILVAQGHTETMGAAADEVDIDVAGVTVIGCGRGKLAPLFDYTGDVTGAFAIAADDVTIANLQFLANVPDVNEAIEVEAGSEQVTIAGCLFYAVTEGTDEFLECIDSSGAASDRLTVIGCHFAMGAGAANSAIYLKDSDYAYIAGNVSHGNYAVANINQVTTASNHIVIADNVLFNGTIGGDAGRNAQPCIELLATTTGMIVNNSVACDVANIDAAILGAHMYMLGNVYCEEDGQNLTPLSMPASDTSDAVDMTPEIPDDTILANILDDGGDTSAYDRRYHSLVALGTDTDALIASQGGAGTTGTKAGMTYASTKVATAASDDLFDVAGGAILITSFVGVVTTEIGAGANTLEINLDADAGWTDYDFSTAVDIDGDLVGQRIVFSNANESVLTPLAGADGGASILMSAWYCGEGMIEQNCSASPAGAITWYMTWIPYADGTTVTAQ